jgi:DNA polymerase I-like protein with 3'-5' exonuclease and polymerase domains
LYDTDFAALEYRTAVMLANCQPGLKSILEKKDRHEMSAAYLYDAIKEDMEADEFKEWRQKAKAGTFQPLYAGVGTTDRSRAYAAAFYEEHTGISRWHNELCSEAIEHKQIVCPDGMIFAFPFAERKSADKVNGKTQIVNYPVQHFATFTIAWSVIYYLWKLMKEYNLKSKLVLQVHDSITADVHPDEKEIMLKLTIQAFSSTLQLLKERFNYETNVPIGFEVSEGKNLLKKNKLYEG